MPVRFLSDAELARLSGWPDEIADADRITFFTLTSDDLGWLASNVRVENRLGAALQLCTLPWLGWIPDDLTACPLTASNSMHSCSPGPWNTTRPQCCSSWLATGSATNGLSARR